MAYYQFSTGSQTCYHEAPSLESALAECFGPGTEHRDAFDYRSGRALPQSRDVRPAGFAHVTCPCGENQPASPGLWRNVAIRTLDRLPKGAVLHPVTLAAHMEAEIAHNRDRVARGWSHWDPERGMVDAAKPR